MRNIFLLNFLFFASIAFLACNKEDDTLGLNSDPLIGNWKLKAITANGQTADVSNTACWKDSYMSIDSSAGKLLLSYPSQNQGGCASDQDNFQWSNKNGTYYFVQNGLEAQMPVQLLDNNQTLQMNISEGTQTIIFSFRK